MRGTASLSPRQNTLLDAFLPTSDFATVVIHAEDRVRLGFREGQGKPVVVQQVEVGGGQVVDGVVDERQLDERINEAGQVRRLDRMFQHDHMNEHTLALSRSRWGDLKPAPPSNGGDTEVMSIEPLALPTAHDWLRYGVADTIELHAGKQSRVFAVRVSGVDLAVKLTDGRLADGAVLGRRMEVVESLASRHHRVVCPRRFDGRLINAVSGWLMTSTEMVVGDHVDASRPETADAMGEALAYLHAQMAELPAQELPAVAALVGVERDPAWSEPQLLHGDFSDQNLILTTDGLCVFDFDDCGYGPIEYDLANSLYMVLFDAHVNGRVDKYNSFRPSSKNSISL